MTPRPRAGRRARRPAGGKRSEAERKEKVLHTRVPESLDRQLRVRARGLGLSVSTVVRHVLQNTFGLVDDIVSDSTNVALAIAGESLPERDEIIGWQEIVLNRNAVCDHCNVVLGKGTRAAIAVRPGPGPLTALCVDCLEAVADSGGGAGRKP